MNAGNAVVLGIVVGFAGLGAGRAVMAQHMEHEMPPPAKVALGAAEVVVPMDSFGGRPVVSLLLNGRGPYRFVLDTGAGGSVMSQSLADSLGLASLGEARVGAPGGATNPGNMVDIGRVEMGDAVLSDLSLVATDLSRVFHLDDHPVGVLSALAFSGCLVTFDYPRKQILVREGELPVANGADIFAYTAEDHIPTLEISVAGVPVRAHLDSGSGHGLMLPAGMADKVPLAGPLVEKGKARTVDGEWPLREAPLKGTVTIGRLHLENPMLMFVEGSTFGNIGYEILKGFVVTVDRGNHRFRLEEPGASATEGGGGVPPAVSQGR